MQKNTPGEAALRRDALDLLERLKFDTAHVLSAGFNASMMRLGTSKRLTSRPLSLPGITGELIEFFERMNAVYSYTVICLDELDKVHDPKELEALLRAVKGVLGQRRTHFILTVSDDALCRFISQRNNEKGMLESTFEQMVVLDRVDFRVADHIVRQMYGEMASRQEPMYLYPSTVMLWLFGSAVPREIKRAALEVLEAGFQPDTSSLESLWKRLFTARIRDLYAWAFRIGDDSEINRRFLSCLDDNIRLIDSDDERLQTEVQLGHSIAEQWLAEFGELIASNGRLFGRLTPLNEERGELQPAKDSRMAYTGAVMDILIGATALTFVRKNEAGELSEGSVGRLVRIFERIPANPSLACTPMWEHLSSMKLPLCRRSTG